MSLPSIRAGLDTLRANPTRTMLSTLGVIIGSASLVAVLSLGDGAEQVARQRVQQEGYNHIIVEPITSDAVDGERIARASVVTVRAADADALAPVIAHRATGALTTQGSLLWTPPAGGVPRGLRVIGIAPIGEMLAIATPLTSGRMLTPAEARAGAPVCLVSQRLATLLAESHQPTHTPGAAPNTAANRADPASADATAAAATTAGGTAAGASSADAATAAASAAGASSADATAAGATAAGATAAGATAAGASSADATVARATPAGPFSAGATTASASSANTRLDRTSAGAAAGSALGRGFVLGGRQLRLVGIQQDLAGDRGFAVVVPLDVALTLLHEPVRRVVLQAARLEDVRPLTEDVRRWAEARDGWKGGIRVAATGQQRLEEIERTFLWFKMLMGTFTAIALIVGGIGIMNVLLASVVERTREIGLRKAVGARRRDIRTQFLTESVAISAAGSLLGLILGLGGAFGITAVMRARTGVSMYAGLSPGTLIAAASAALLVGLVFGTYPALRAARLSPVDAIQRE